MEPGGTEGKRVLCVCNASENQPTVLSTPLSWKPSYFVFHDRRNFQEKYHMFLTRVYILHFLIHFCNIYTIPHVSFGLVLTPYNQPLRDAYNNTVL